MACAGGNRLIQRLHRGGAADVRAVVVERGADAPD